MPHDSCTSRPLEERIRHLETTLRRIRLTVLMLLALALPAGLVAWKWADEIRTERILLTDGVGTPVMVLRGEDGDGGPALVLETPAGRRLLALGPVVRPVR